MPVPLLGGLDKLTCIAVLLVSASPNAADCREGSSNSVVYQKVELNGGQVCLVESGRGGQVVARPSGGGAILRNSALVDKSDIMDGSVHIEPVGSAVKIYFEYPNNVYSIDFDLRDFSVEESLVTLILRDSGDAPPDKIVLKTKPEIVERARFELVDKDGLFGSDNLVLDGEVEVRVAVSKIKIFRLPSLDADRGMYLVEGDLIRILSYRDGWLEFVYKMRNGRSVRGWIPMSDII